MEDILLLDKFRGIFCFMNRVSHLLWLATWILRPFDHDLKVIWHNRISDSCLDLKQTTVFPWGLIHFLQHQKPRTTEATGCEHEVYVIHCGQEEPRSVFISGSLASFSVLMELLGWREPAAVIARLKKTLQTHVWPQYSSWSQHYLHYKCWLFCVDVLHALLIHFCS